jgi:hypothetical protein
LGGYPPNAPTDPYVRALAHTVPPFMVLPHGRSRAPSVALEACLAIRPCCGDTLSDVDASGVVPKDGSMLGRPASLIRVTVEGRSPCFSRRHGLPFGTTRTLRLPAIPPAALRFPSLGGTTVASGVCSPHRPTRRRGAGVLLWGATRARGHALRLRRRLTVEMAGSPKFPQKPLPPRSCSFDPGRTGRNSPCRSDRRGHGYGNVRGFFDDLSRLNRMARRLAVRLRSPQAVYASHRRVAARHARLASGCVAALCRAGLAPAGSHKERFQLRV